MSDKDISELTKEVNHLLTQKYVKEYLTQFKYEFLIIFDTQNKRIKQLEGRVKILEQTQLDCG